MEKWVQWWLIIVSVVALVGLIVLFWIARPIIPALSYIQQLPGIVGELDPPTPGPITMLEPSDNGDGTDSPDWTIGDGTAEPGRSGELRHDLFGEVLTFHAKYEDGVGTKHTKSIKSMTVEITPSGGGGSKKLVLSKIRVGLKNLFQWELDGSTIWDVCYLEKAPMCEKSGLPPEFFGTLTSWTVQLDGSGAPPLKVLRMTAQAEVD